MLGLMFCFLAMTFIAIFSTIGWKMAKRRIAELETQVNYHLVENLKLEKLIDEADHLPLDRLLGRVINAAHKPENVDPLESFLPLAIKVVEKTKKKRKKK